MGTHLIIDTPHVLDLLLTDTIRIQLEPVSWHPFLTIHIMLGARFLAGTVSKLLI